MKIIPAIRELTAEQADDEAERFFPLTDPQRDRCRQTAAENVCGSQHKTVAAYLLGKVPKSSVTRLIKEETEQLVRWRRLEAWKAATGARWDSQRSQYVTIGKPI
jgi:hypothetical protein